jgi:hypothetical protein
MSQRVQLETMAAGIEARARVLELMAQALAVIAYDRSIDPRSVADHCLKDAAALLEEHE